MKNLLLSVSILCIMLFVGCVGYINVPDDKLIAVEPIIPVVSVDKFEEVEDVSKIKIAEQVMFNYDSADIRADQEILLDKVAVLMKEYPDTVLLLEGFASKEGGNEYNQKLSVNRTLAVYNALIERGVGVDRFIGMDAHGATNQFDDENLSPNRTVVILSLEALIHLDI